MRKILEVPLIKAPWGEIVKKYKITPPSPGYGFYELKYSLSVDPEFHEREYIVKYRIEGHRSKPIPAWVFGIYNDVPAKKIPVKGEGKLDFRHAFKAFRSWNVDEVLVRSATETKRGEYPSGGHLYFENLKAIYYAFARIKGRVIDAKTLQPIAGATVKLKSELDYEFETKTNEEGKFAIGELYSLPLSVTYIPEGKYKITVSKAEYAKKEFEIKANPGENSIGDIKLMPIPTPPPPSPPPPPGIPEKVNWSLLALMALGAYLMLRGLQRRR
ncbi:MAG: hypothetical protein DRN25_00860 [Thermoplasmata archaeon]|nr:MAG: hypothetical protein DRN25_00860 [Thermoplasmata archaeon]